MPAKLDFSKLFKDTKGVPDDTKITLPNGAEVTMGDLREYDTQRGGELQAELTRQADALKRDRAELQKASERVAQTYVALEAEKAKLAGGGGRQAADTGADPLSEYETDKVFGPPVRYMREVESKLTKQLTDLQNSLKTISEAQAKMGVTYIGEKAARDFADIMSRPAAEEPWRPADLSLDALYKTAVEQRIYDRNNLPDLKETYKRVTADARHQHELKQAEERGRAARDKELAESAMLPVPGVGPFGGQKARGEELPKNLNDAFSKAGQDKEMWKEVHTNTLIGGGTLQ